MFKRKQDVDKHVLSVLNRKKDEKERNAQGYQIARLYLDIKEYETAKRYLASFLKVRENSPQAHQMMGEINEALGKKDLAVDNYKRALDLGGFGSSNRQLVLKICELYCDLGTEDQRMKYWLQKCEELFPQSDIVYRMKSQILSSSSSGSNSDVEMEKLLLDELMNRPKDLDLRIKLLHLYLDMDRIEEAFDAALDTDLTMAFVDSLPWYECVQAVFEKHRQNNPECTSDPDFLLMNMHVLRNVTYLSLPTKPTNTSAQLMRMFDKAVNDGGNANLGDDSWLALLKEMKAQVLYLAGLFLVKKAMMGSLQWHDSNQLSGACLLACVGVSPLDPQAAWFLKPRKEYLKFYNWWYQQSNDRLSQAGHMIQQLSQNDVTDWSRQIHSQVMTGSGHRRVFESVFCPGAGGSSAHHSQDHHEDESFLYGCDLMVSKVQEPLTHRQLLDIDRVAYQVHLDKLSHLVWLCLQRYSPNMDFQPNYHFNLMENIQYSVKNIEASGSENLCQLDVLTFLLASVRCAASSISDNVFSYDDQSGRPTLLPISLSRPFCTQDQEEWWDAAYKFCSNSAKDNFSRLRRVLIRGVEVVRLRGTHGMSIAMQCHLARCLDAKVKSLKESEFGCRCSAAELSALEARALFYWERAHDALLKFKKNQHPPAVKNRLFKEAGDGDLPPRLVDKLMSECEFAIALSLMARNQHEDALDRFGKHPSPWASFYSAQILRRQAEECHEADKGDAFKSLMRKARESLYKTLDRLSGDKSHELNFLVSKEMDDLEVEIQGFDWDENESSGGRDNTFYTPTKTPSFSNTASMQRGGEHHSSYQFAHSTPRRPLSNEASQLENSAATDVGVTPSASQMSQVVNGTSPQPLRPSPERLDSQIKSLGYSQTTLFRMVLDRNEELVLMHSRIMEEHGTHNAQLQEALTENKKLMEDLKLMLVENRDMLKGIKTEIAALKTSVITPPSPLPTPAAMPPGPQLIVAPTHLPHQPPRGPFPGFPHPQATPAGLPSYHPGYLLNSPIPPGVAPQPAGAGAPPNYRLPGSSSSSSRGPSQVGKFKLGLGGVMGGEDDEDVVDEGDDLEHTVEDLSAMYPEYFDEYSQYYTPDSHLQDWALRSGVDPTTGSSLSMSPAMQQQPAVPTPSAAPRMPMPQPGFFASALRGQALQYQQQQQPSPSQQPASAASISPAVAAASHPAVQPLLSSASTTSKIGGVVGGNVIGPGFFATPTAGEGMNVAAVGGVSPTVQGNIPIFSAMSSMGTTSSTVNSQVTGLKEALSNGGQARSSEDLGASLGFKVLFHIKALLPAKIVNGGITILRGPNNSRTTVVMMSDREDMVFQHDASGLILKPAAPGSPGITWTANKIGSSEKETVTIVTVPESMGTLLRDALQKAAAFVPDSTAVTSPAQPAAPAGGAGGAKTVFGGISFSSTPVLTPHTEREKATPHKGATSPVKTDSPVKPFAGVSLNVPKATTASSPSVNPANLQGASSPSKSPGRRDDERIEEYEPNVDFKPVIPLPELVEKKTGEENETAVFVDRCRLFRYDTQTNQWKERGVGEMKILCDNKEHRYRVVMRRDQIFKLCANHFISDSMKLSPLASSDKTWCYSAMDYSDEEMKMEQLAVKFKNPDKAKRFKDAFEDCVTKTKKGEVGAGDGKKDTKNVADKKDSTDSVAASKPPFSFFTQTSTAATPPNPTSTTASKPLVTSATPAAAAPPSASAAKGDLSELFKPKPGSWECPSCLCRNNAEQLNCPACKKAKPGSEPSTTGAGSSSSSVTFNIQPGGGFRFGSSPSTTTEAPSSSNSLFGGGSSGVTFGAPPASKPQTSSTSSSSTTAVSSSSAVTPAVATGATSSGKAAVPLSELFKPKAGSWECNGCYCQNQAEHLQCPACGQKQPGVKAEDEDKSGGTGSAGGGFTFSKGGGFTFGGLTPGQTNTSSSTPSTGGFSFGSPIAAATTNPSTTPSTTTTAAAAAAPKSTGFTFGSGGGFVFGGVASTKSSAAATPAATATTTASSAAVATPTKPATTTTSAKSGGGGLLASLLTSEEPETKPVENSGGFSFSMTPGQKSAANQAATANKNQTANSSSAGFNFNFQKSPVATTAPSTATTGGVPGTPIAKGSPRVPNSPEIDEQGLYVTKEGEDSHIHFEPIIQLPDKIEAKTGEEDEEVLFESRARMYRFMSGEWKEKGIGVMKILQHRQTKRGRVLMRRDQVLKICCNHTIKPDLDLQPMPKMEGKAWLWFAYDFSDEEGKMEQLAIRFKKPETAQEFKTVFDGCKNAVTSGTPQKDVKQEAAAGDSDDDVIFVKEEKSPAAMSRMQQPSVTTTPTSTKSTTSSKTDYDDGSVVFVKKEEATAEQKSLAAKYQLPTNFYLYEKRKPCKGCLGCTDGEGLPPHAKKPPAGKTMSYAAAAKSPVKPTIGGPTTPSASSIFGANVSSSTPPASTAKTPQSSQGIVGKSIFGSHAGLNTSSSIFGGGSASSSPSNNAGSGSKPTTPSIFGGAGGASSNAGTPSIFGSGSPATTTSPLFGAKPSVFGGNSPAGTQNKDFSSLLKGSNTTPSSTTTTGTSSSSSFVFGAGSSTPDFSSLAASGSNEATFLKKTEASGPFKFQGAGQKLFGAGASPGGGDGDGDGVAPSTDVHFEPIIPLPELVEVKTGEEDWTNVFCHRAKLFKFDNATKQWKERGIGDIKIMSYNKEVMFRILQRREQVLKVSCNHLINREMNLSPMSTSLSSWCWVANDLADEEPSVTQFAVKFKTKEIAAKFKTAFEECQAKLAEAEEQVKGGNENELKHKQEVIEEDLSTSVVAPLGGARGNIYHSKALDVAGQDRMTETMACNLLEQQRKQEVIKEDMMTATAITPLGGGGNIYHGKALDVGAEDRMTETMACNPLEQQRKQEVVKEDMMTATAITPLGGGGGNIYHSKALDVAGQDRMTDTSYNNLHQDRQEVVEEGVSATTFTPFGLHGNPYHSQTLDVTAQDRMTDLCYIPLEGEVTTATRVTPLGGDVGNPYHSKALNLTAQDRMTDSSYIPLELEEEVTTATRVTPLGGGGGGGNIYHSKALDVGAEDRMTETMASNLLEQQRKQEVVKEEMVTATAITPLGGRGGNIYHSKALDVTVQDKMTVTASLKKPSSQMSPKNIHTDASTSSLSSSSTAGHKTSVMEIPSTSTTLDHPCQNATVTSTTPDQQATSDVKEEQPEEEEEAGDEDDDDEYEDVDDDDEDDDEVVYEKRATLHCYTSGKWKNLGTGQLCVKYNDDLNGNSIGFIKDDGKQLASHVICREHDLGLDPKTKSCEWKPLDYATGESIRQHFKVVFSSMPAAEEFAKIFMEGKRLAIDSELSEKLPTDIDVPEVFSRGEVQKK